MSSPFSAKEWSVLKQAPILVFYYVAKADDVVEEQEVERLISHFESPERYKSSFFTKVVEDIMGDPAALAELGSQVIADDNRNVQTQISAVRVLVDEKLDAEEAKGFKEALVDLGTDVAAATGDAELPISKEEWAEVTALKKLLQL